ncbi:MAG: 23S rRNA (pseudouridine(1915)-N(3))-methyltransferase RlmH [Cycloclasticus sp. symbiont of Poecilosclerida sp. M]|nr:MAG: 23S rRNA (pseudouridine(1915)-N(3))-methyltransferase RlmH [Cycloclasticus sp. symbiont of Poecilosclerida sp. M]
MKLKILSIGAKMPTWVQQAYAEYAKRMPRECSIQLVEIASAKRSKKSDIKKIKEEEKSRLLNAVNSTDYVVALDEKGKAWSTADTAKKMLSWQGVHQVVVLLIGGPDGLHEACLERANECWSLSALTFPHPLVRVILAEQLYRAWSLMNNHPYHRE